MDDRYVYAYIGTLSIIIALFIEFLIGIYINLAIPSAVLSGSTITNGHYSPGDFMLIMVHISLGFFIVLISFLILTLSIKLKRAKLIFASSLATAFIITAVSVEILFLFKSTELYSFTTKSAFIIALVSELYYIYRIRH
ncbi:MAG: hypothetical protein QXZ44_04605 [Ferroplasma sp.]